MAARDPEAGDATNGGIAGEDFASGNVEYCEKKTGTSASMKEVKFIPKEDLHIELPPPKFALTKEELLKFEKDPFWIRMRYITFILFWVVWLALLAGAVIIVVVSPPCPPVRALKTYEVGMYHVDVKLFRGSVGQKTGTLEGLRSEVGVNYIMSLHIPSVLLHNVIDKDGKLIADVFADKTDSAKQMEELATTLKAFKQKNAGQTTILDMYLSVPMETYSGEELSKLFPSKMPIAGAKGYVFQEPLRTDATNAKAFVEALNGQRDTDELAPVGVYMMDTLDATSINASLESEKAFAYDKDELNNLVQFVIYNVDVGGGCKADCLQTLTASFEKARPKKEVKDGEETGKYKNDLWRSFALNHMTLDKSLSERFGGNMCTKQTQGECFYRFAAGLALPGSPVYYAGDELGQQKNGLLFRWGQNSEESFIAGIENEANETIRDDYISQLSPSSFGADIETSVTVQSNSKGTELLMVREITAMRRPPKRAAQPNALQYGFSSAAPMTDVFLVTRCTQKHARYYVALNFKNAVLIAKPADASGNATIILPQHSSLTNTHHEEGIVNIEKKGVRVEAKSAVLLRLDNMVADNCDIPA